ncbi:MAG: transcriptional repressor [Erysipelotrichaceae bacterium]
MTKRGKLIYEYFLNHPQSHPTAEEIYIYLKSLDDKVGIATVYRNLKALVDMQHLREINLEKQGVRYDLIDHEHYHFICDSCGCITNFTLDTLKNINKEIEEKTKGNVLSKDLIFHGICESCLKKKEK